MCLLSSQMLMSFHPPESNLYSVLIVDIVSSWEDFFTTTTASDITVAGYGRLLLAVLATLVAGSTGNTISCWQHWQHWMYLIHSTTFLIGMEIKLPVLVFSFVKCTCFHTLLASQQIHTHFLWQLLLQFQVVLHWCRWPVNHWILVVSRSLLDHQSAQEREGREQINSVLEDMGGGGGGGGGGYAC